MKTYNKLCALLLTAVTLSCTETISPDINPDGSSVHTFTASINDTKLSLGENGTATWLVGDWIMVSNLSVDILTKNDDTKGIIMKENNSQPENIETEDGQLKKDGKIVAEWIQIKEDDLSKDKKTLTIKTSVVENEKYYFCVVNEKTNIYSVSKNGDIITRQITNASLAKNNAVQVASCSAGEKKLSFENYNCFIRFKCRGYYSFILEGNNGEDVCRYYTIKGNDGSVILGTPDAPSASYTARSIEVYTYNSNDWVYIPIAPTLNLPYGFTILGKKQNSSSTAEVIVSTKGSITFPKGKILNLGDISGLTLSLYGSWEAEKDLIVGDNEQRFNKNSTGEAGIRIIKDTVLTEPGVYFVESGVTVTYNGSKSIAGGVKKNNAYFFIIGNDATNKPTLHITESIQIGCINESNSQVIFLKNLNITSDPDRSAIFSMYWLGNKSSIIIDDCNIHNVHSNGCLYTSPVPDDTRANNMTINFRMYNSNYHLSEENTATNYILGNNAVTTIETMTLKNNIFWRTNNISLLLSQACTHRGVITLENNTFFNCAKIESNGGLIAGNFTENSDLNPVINNNLIYLSEQHLKASDTALIHTGWTHTPNTANIGNNYYYFTGDGEKTVDGVFYPSVVVNFRNVYSISNSNMKKLDTTPIYPEEWCNGVFTNTTTYGARR